MSHLKLHHLLPALAIVASTPSILARTVTDSDEYSTYSFSLQGCQFKTEVRHQVYNPDLRSSACQNADEAMRQFVVDLRRVQEAKFTYYNESQRGPELKFRCGTESCGRQDVFYTNGCKDDWVGDSGKIVETSFTGTPKANSVFPQMWNQVRLALRTCAPKAEQVERLERSLSETAPIVSRTSRAKKFEITHRDTSGTVTGSCADGASFSASLDGVYRSMPYGACAYKKGCESGVTIEEAIRKACRE